VAEAIAAANGQRIQDRAERATRIEASWRERALNAEDALSHAKDEISSSSAERSRSTCRVRSHTALWCARATSFTASAR
jgi:hypothetical protein